MAGVFRFVDRWQSSLHRDGDEQREGILETRDFDLEAYLQSSVGSSPWFAPTFTNAWVDYGSPWQPARYRKIGDIVSIEGLVKNGTAGLAMFTLPTGFRPPSGMIFATASMDGFAVRYHGELRCTSAGVFTSEGAQNVYVSINCSFSVTP